MLKTSSLLSVGVIAALLFSFADTMPSNQVKIWVFDVGQGDAIFIDTPHKQILIDGGADALVLERLAAVMPWWDRSIDIVVNTHPHADHLMGLLPVFERYKVSQILDADEGYTTSEFHEYLKLAGGKRGILAGDVTVDLGNGVHLRTLWPPKPYNDAVLDDPNDGSIMFLLEYGDFSMLLTGDAGIEEEKAIIDSAFCCSGTAQPCPDQCLGDIDVLKVGHHGSDTSTSQELLDLTQPEIAVISLGKDNEYNHPSTFVIDRLWRSGATVYRTDINGTIGIFTDGEGIEVVERDF